MLSARAPAKLNLALLVGPLRSDGRHEVVTVVEKLTLADTVTLARGDGVTVRGFPDDTLVRAALVRLAEAAGERPGFAATVAKRVPVAAGLGGGSSDAAAALELGNRLLDVPLERGVLERLGARLGADVPLFLTPGSVVCRGDGTLVEACPLPSDYHVVLWHPPGAHKTSTADVYRQFDARSGDRGFRERRRTLEDALPGMGSAVDLARLPPNDLATSPLAARLLELGAFRADVCGAGPTLYGLFLDASAAAAAAASLAASGRTWLTRPAPGA
jgi:4-diphosphocytidyl-2-C-methyl-D-erythritol kinase